MGVELGLRGIGVVEGGIMRAITAVGLGAENC